MRIIHAAVYYIYMYAYIARELPRGEGDPFSASAQANEGTRRYTRLPRLAKCTPCRYCYRDRSLALAHRAGTFISRARERRIRCLGFSSLDLIADAKIQDINRVVALGKSFGILFFSSTPGGDLCAEERAIDNRNEILMFEIMSRLFGNRVPATNVLPLYNETPLQIKILFYTYSNMGPFI